MMYQRPDTTIYRDGNQQLWHSQCQRQVRGIEILTESETEIEPISAVGQVLIKFLNNINNNVQYVEPDTTSKIPNTS